MRGQGNAGAQPGGEPVRISPAGTLVVEGFGTSISVQAGQLVVRTGTGRTVRTGRFERASRPKLRRLVIVGRTGVVTLPALDWVYQVGGSWSWIGRDGKVLATSSQLGLNDGRLRRAQALAPFGESGREVVRYLLRWKVAGQLQSIRTRFADATGAADEIERARSAIEDASTIEELRLLEAQAAAAYWSGWRGLSLTFARKDVSRVPPRWTSFESRTSLVTGNQRSASDPVGAMLNLGYGLLECEARVCMAATGLDAGLAFGLHYDQRGRANGAVDLMEAARAAVDELVLDTIDGHVFRGADFHELPNGVCRIAPALARSLIEAWVPAISAAVAPHAEAVAAMLAADAGVGRMPTWLTGANRSAGRGRKRPSRRPDRSTPTASSAPLPPACVSCGVVLDDRARMFCDECHAEHEAEKLSRLVKAGPATLAKLRAEGRDPSATPEARAKLGAAIGRRNQEAAEWNRLHGSADPEAFRRDILPALAELSLTRLSAVTGLSITQCARIRRGDAVPHARHWKALASLIEGPAPSGFRPTRKGV